MQPTLAAYQPVEQHDYEKVRWNDCPVEKQSNLE